MPLSRSSAPDWPHLYEIAAAQEGHFTTAQAADAGYSSQLLNHHVKNGRMLRIRRGIYRLVHFPAGDHEGLTVLWLWSEHAGVFSHDTALFLYDLSDILPHQAFLTLPKSWRTRRLRVPKGVRLYYGDVPKKDRRWHGAVPITAPARSIIDCARSGLSPEFVLQASHEAIERGLVSREKLSEVDEILRPFGGLAL